MGLTQPREEVVDYVDSLALCRIVLATAKRTEIFHFMPSLMGRVKKNSY